MSWFLLGMVFPKNSWQKLIGGRFSKNMTKVCENKEEQMWDSLEDFAKSFSEDELKKLKEENPNLYETIMSLIWE